MVFICGGTCIFIHFECVRYFSQKLCASLMTNLSLIVFGEVIHLGDVNQFDLTAGQGHSHVTGFGVSGQRAGRGGRRLRLTITWKYVNCQYSQRHDMRIGLLGKLR